MRFGNWQSFLILGALVSGAACGRGSFRTIDQAATGTTAEQSVPQTLSRDIEIPVEFQQGPDTVIPRDTTPSAPDIVLPPDPEQRKQDDQQNQQTQQDGGTNSATPDAVGAAPQSGKTTPQVQAQSPEAQQNQTQPDVTPAAPTPQAQTPAPETQAPTPVQQQPAAPITQSAPPQTPVPAPQTPAPQTPAPQAPATPPADQGPGAQPEEQAQRPTQQTPVTQAPAPQTPAPAPAPAPKPSQAAPTQNTEVKPEQQPASRPLPVPPTPPTPRPQVTGQAPVDIAARMQVDPERGVQPKVNFTRQLEQKYHDHLNRGRAFSELSEHEQIKWVKIFNEMRRVANIRGQVPQQLLYIEKAAAVELSKKFEKDRTVSQTGAWTIALEGTATRHGFVSTPCAEFMSELLRQAYERAGYHATEDFTKANPLIYTNTASVTGLGYALVKAGWSVWDASKYRAPMGAIMVHTFGETPSHTYMAAGFDGSMIIDNGAPHGRDLRKSSAKVIALAYQTGAFFLPPGFLPATWDQAQ